MLVAPATHQPASWGTSVADCVSAYLSAPAGELGYRDVLSPETHASSPCHDLSRGGQQLRDVGLRGRRATHEDAHIGQDLGGSLIQWVLEQVPVAKTSPGDEQCGLLVVGTTIRDVANEVEPDMPVPHWWPCHIPANHELAHFPFAVYQRPSAAFTPRLSPSIQEEMGVTGSSGRDAPKHDSRGSRIHGRKRIQIRSRPPIVHSERLSCGSRGSDEGEMGAEDIDAEGPRFISEGAGIVRATRSRTKRALTPYAMIDSTIAARIKRRRVDGDVETSIPTIDAVPKKTNVATPLRRSVRKKKVKTRIDVFLWCIEYAGQELPLRGKESSGAIAGGSSSCLQGGLRPMVLAFTS
ncbi:hypothetical protein LXA43DRAFT_1064244 [Ganoderma leucocontextum]|nr:hypothetical protein LXA43DRAFT_1064244 [Ganoderma leucocontextum]